MQIKSDETPKKNRVKEFLKSHQTSDISKTVSFIVVGIATTIWLFVTLDGVYKKQELVQRENENKQVQEIIAHKPVLKYYTHYYLPDEYELVEEGGRYFVEANPKGLDKNKVYLSNCDLLLSKKVTDSFRQAVYKKRGYTSGTENAQKDLPSKSIDARVETNGTKHKKFKPGTKVNDSSDIHNINNVIANIHTSDYYQRKEYADGYYPLVKSYQNLETYKLTDDYKKLKRFERTKELENLNKDYNLKRANMWKLHYRFGFNKGTFDELQEGKLSVKMIQGKLEFGRSF